MAGSTTALGAALTLGPRLSHAEFRLLILLADHPVPSGREAIYEAPLETLMSKGRFCRAEIKDVAYGLKWMRGQDVILFPTDVIRWTL